MKMRARRAERTVYGASIGALALLLLACLSGCVGPGLEPPARDPSSGPGASSDAGANPQGGRGGNGGSFGNAGSSGAGSAQAGKGGKGGSPDVGQDAATLPGMDAGGDEDAGVD